MTDLQKFVKNIEEIQAEVARIDAIKRDYEIAHGEEDKLYLKVLNLIAEGTPNPDGLARAVLVTKDIKFNRVYS